MRLSAEKVHEVMDGGQPPPASIDPAALAGMAVALRAILLTHRQSGIASYPLTPALRRFLAAKNVCSSGQSEPASPGRQTIGFRPEGTPIPPVFRQAESGGLDALMEDIAACRLCGLAEARQGQVRGRGGTSSGLMFIGDCSSQSEVFSAEILFGVEEDVMLWNMVRAVGLTPKEVRATNAVQCCPLPGRTPDPESGQQCLVHLRREIALVRPQIICAMGEIAAAAVLGCSESVVRLRGRFHEYTRGGEDMAGIQVMVTFHPRFLLKQPEPSRTELKKAAWQDLQMIQRRLRQLADKKG